VSATVDVAVDTKSPSISAATATCTGPAGACLRDGDLDFLSFRLPSRPSTVGVAEPGRPRGTGAPGPAVGYLRRHASPVGLAFPSSRGGRRRAHGRDSFGGSSNPITALDMSPR
jgi:hypothetical protein